MDYTPITAHRVLVAFAATILTALMPAMFMILRAAPVGFLGGPHGGYRGIVLGVETVTLTLVLLILLLAVVTLGRRLIRRPFRV